MATLNIPAYLFFIVCPAKGDIPKKPHNGSIKLNVSWTPSTKQLLLAVFQTSESSLLGLERLDGSSGLHGIL